MRPVPSASAISVTVAAAPAPWRCALVIRQHRRRTMCVSLRLGLLTWRLTGQAISDQYLPTLADLFGRNVEATAANGIRIKGNRESFSQLRIDDPLDCFPNRMLTISFR